MAVIYGRRTLASSLLRALSSSSSSSSIASRSRFTFAIPTKETPKFPIRFQTSVWDDSTTDSCCSVSNDSPVKDLSTNSSKSALKETIDPLDHDLEQETIDFLGHDLEHWLIIMDFSKTPKTSEAEMVNAYVKTLAEVVGSKEEAKKKIYSVSTTTYTGFGAQISKELSAKIKGLPEVLRVLPDAYVDIVNKDYGGDLFVDGKVIPRPKCLYSQNQLDIFKTTIRMIGIRKHRKMKEKS